ncbi:MAG: Xaa-Pro dipeptidase [Pseudomonadota bacterium]
MSRRPSTVSDRDRELSDLFPTHLESVSENWTAALAATGYDAVLVAAGEPRNNFLDDQAPPQKLNPHFLQWCPSETASGSMLLLRPGQTPRFFFLSPEDYWHQPPALPPWAAAFEVERHADRDSLLAAAAGALPSGANRVAFIGEAGADEIPELGGENVNPEGLLAHLHFDRARKTPFEVAAMRAATARAVCGHLAAREAFDAGASEFEINLAYLGASEQLPADLPYQNIVALNEHAGVLHYQYYDRSPPAERRSFLIDAGGSHLGYAADITRTYAAQGGVFADLISALDEAQRSLIDTITIGTSFLDLHVAMHQSLAGLLTESGLLTCSADEAFEAGLTEVFLPHGLGHLIGLQTHDVGGQQADHDGTLVPPPENYPALRTTRSLSADMPVTIEPGLYFIPQLLDAARNGPARDSYNWPAIDALVPAGGIRIEDNVLLTKTGGIENLTRDAFAALDNA